jgi:putative endonuclease
MSNQTNTVTYTGVTSVLSERIYQHKEKIAPGFTSRYNINKLIYFEEQADAVTAIHREKQIKSWTRKKKVDLIESLNPVWHDLYDEL